MCGGRALRIIQSNQEAIPSALGTCFIIYEKFKQIDWVIFKLSFGNKYFVIFQSGGKALRSIQSNPEAIPSTLGTCFIICENLKRIESGRNQRAAAHILCHVTHVLSWITRNFCIVTSSVFSVWCAAAVKLQVISTNDGQKQT